MTEPSRRRYPSITTISVIGKAFVRQQERGAAHSGLHQTSIEPNLQGAFPFCFYLLHACYQWSNAQTPRVYEMQLGMPTYSYSNNLVSFAATTLRSTMLHRHERVEAMHRHVTCSQCLQLVNIWCCAPKTVRRHPYVVVLASATVQR
jgi:hypothetical protein